MLDASRHPKPLAVWLSAMTMSKIPRHIWNGPTHETEDAPSPDAVPSDPYPSSHQICDLEPQKGQLLIVSPYTSPPHLLALSTLNDAQQLLAHALTNLEATHTGYATASYTSSFNWSTVISILRNLATSQEYTWQHQHFYIVVFRSRIPPTTDRIHLGGLDRYAHAEAMKSGGLLKYWFGVPDAEGRNLATCRLEPLLADSSHYKVDYDRA